MYITVHYEAKFKNMFVYEIIFCIQNFSFTLCNKSGMLKIELTEAE